MALSVVICDDSMIVRAGLARILEAEGCVVAGEAGDAQALLREVAFHQPDVAIVDIRMPPTYHDEGIVAANMIRRRFPATAVLVLSQYVDVDYANALLAESATHVGYLLKDRVLDRASLLVAVWRVCAGESVVDAELVKSLLSGPQVPEALARLSSREREVLALMAEGYADRGIAQRLQISAKTVATHVQHIFQRLEIPDSTTANKRVRAVLAYLGR